MKTTALLVGLLSLGSLALSACGGSVSEDPREPPTHPSPPSPTPPDPTPPSPTPPNPGCGCSPLDEACDCPDYPVPATDAGAPVDASIDVDTCGEQPGIACGYAGGGDCTVSLVCMGGEWVCGPAVCVGFDAGPPACHCPDDAPDCSCGVADGGDFDGDPPTTACGAGYVEVCDGPYCICTPADAGGCPGECKTVHAGDSVECECP